MTRLRQIFLWTFLLNRRILKQPVFLLLIALVPVLVFGVNMVAKETSSLVTVAAAPGNENDEASVLLIRSLEKDSTAAVKYFSCPDETSVREAVASGKARLGIVFPKDLNALFAAYGAQETQDLNAGALQILGSLLTSASAQLHEDPILCFTATNDIVAKLTREQLFGKLYPSLEKAVLKTWLKLHPEIGTMTEEERDRFVDETIEKYKIDYNFFELEYLDGTKITDEEIDRYLASPMRGLLAVLVTLTGLAAALYLMDDLDRGRFVWIAPQYRPLFCYGCLLIPIVDLTLVSIAALFAGSSFTNFYAEIPAMILFCFSTAGFANLLRVTVRRKNLLAASIPILLSACLFLTPVFIDLTIFEPVQILLPPYLYLKAIHSVAPLWTIALYAALTSIAGILVDFIRQ